MGHGMGHGSWVMGHGSWVMGHGSWVMGHGSWVMGHGSWVMGHGSWVMGHGSWVMGHGSWVMGHGQFRCPRTSLGTWVAFCVRVRCWVLLHSTAPLAEGPPKGDPNLENYPHGTRPKPQTLNG